MLTLVPWTFSVCCFIRKSMICFKWSHLLTFPNCLRSWMREPLPKELVKLAWKARVGYSCDKTATHRFWFKYKQSTTQSFNIKTESASKSQNQRWTFCKNLTVTQVGMRSHLFNTKIRCFQGFSFFRYASMLLERVPMGSRASSTWMTTSDESITWKNNEHTSFNVGSSKVIKESWCRHSR